MNLTQPVLSSQSQPKKVRALFVRKQHSAPILQVESLRAHPKMPACTRKYL